MKQKMSQIILLRLLRIAHALCSPLRFTFINTHTHTHTTNRTRMNQTNPRLLMNADVHFPLEKSRQRAPLPGHSLVAYSSARRAKRRWICTPSTANSHSVSCKVVSTEHLIVCDGASCLLFPFFPFQSLWPG